MGVHEVQQIFHSWNFERLILWTSFKHEKSTAINVVFIWLNSCGVVKLKINIAAFWTQEQQFVVFSLNRFIQTWSMRTWSHRGDRSQIFTLSLKLYIKHICIHKNWRQWWTACPFCNGVLSTLLVQRVTWMIDIDETSTFSASFVK